MTKTFDIDLGYAFGLPPAEAVAYFESKGYQISFNWWEMADEAHSNAFTVAKATKIDVLQTIRKEVQNALSHGITEREFINRLTPRLQSLGWWGIKPHPSLEGEFIQEGSPWRLQTIYRTNSMSAYNAGRYKQQIDNVANQPYLQYIAVNDERTRASHAAMHNMVFRADDPIWQTHYPPNDWRCRCRVRALDNDDIEYKKLVVQSSDGLLDDVQLEAGTDKTTGEVIFKRGVRYNGAHGSMTPAAGFNSNAGAGVDWSEINLPTKTRALFAADADRILQDHVTHPIKMQAYTRFVDNVFVSKQQSGKHAVVGYMQQTDIDYLAAKGQKVSTGAIVAEDRVMVGKKALRHQRENDALTIDEWKVLPFKLAKPEQVLYDTRNNTILYVVPSDADNKIKIVVQAARQDRKLGEYESIRTAFKVTADDIEGNLKGGIYERVR